MEPNDVDCVLLFRPRVRKNRKALAELHSGLPFLEISIVNPKGFDELVNGFFTVNRDGEPKGMIEVIE